MKYPEFEQRVIATFNRMHYVESCDDAFIVEGSLCDVQQILSTPFCAELEIRFTPSTGYTVRREILMRQFDENDEFYPEMLDSFNAILDRYNVVPHDVEKLNIKGLQLI